MKHSFPSFEARPLDAASLRIHDRALACAKQFRRAEAELLRAIIEVDRARLYEKFAFTFLTPYCVKELGLSEEVAACFVRVARKCAEVPELCTAVEKGRITVSKARRIVTVITRKNHEEWIARAERLTKEKLEAEVAKASPLPPQRESLLDTGRGSAILKLELTREQLERLTRARELVSRKLGRQVSWGETIEFLVSDYLERHDPVQRAKRSKTDANRAQARSFCKTLRAHVRHAVHRRDRGRCQAMLPDGSKCGEGRWVHLHHIHPRSEGGDDSVENLVTLCSAHHRQWHDRGH